MRVFSAIIQDIRFQFRHGFYYAYLIICTFYVLLLQVIPLEARKTLVIILIFTDPAILGFFFIGGIVLLEKGQRILENLFVTPLKIREYFMAKITSLTFLASLVSLVIVIFSFGLSFSLLPLLLGVILGSIFFVLMGFALAARAKSINGFLLSTPLISIWAFLPFLSFLNLYDNFLFYLLPGKGILILLEAAFSRSSIWLIVYAILLMLCWIVFAYLWAKSWFYKYIILKIGGKK